MLTLSCALKISFFTSLSLPPIKALQCSNLYSSLAWHLTSSNFKRSDFAYPKDACYKFRVRTVVTSRTPKGLLHFPKKMQCHILRHYHCETRTTNGFISKMVRGSGKRWRGADMEDKAWRLPKDSHTGHPQGFPEKRAICYAHGLWFSQKTQCVITWSFDLRKAQVRTQIPLFFQRTLQGCTQRRKKCVALCSEIAKHLSSLCPIPRVQCSLGTDDLHTSCTQIWKGSLLGLWLKRTQMVTSSS